MTMFHDWPVWAPPLLWTAVIMGLAWALGHFVAAVAITRAPQWLTRHQHALLHGSIRIVRKRLPWWVLLVGVWLSAAYWPLTPQEYQLVEQALFTIGAVSVTLAAAAIASLSVDAYGAMLAPVMPVSSLTRNIAWTVVAVIGLLVILNGLGLSITPMITALGVGGLAVALALQEPLANFFAGLFITLAGQIRVGDYVTLDGGQEGYILDFSWRSTRLRMLSNNLIIVPNAKLAQAIVINHHLPSQDMAVLVEVGVDYASDLAHVERVVVDVARDIMKRVPGGVPGFEPFVRYHTFADSSINFTVILRGQEFVDQYLIKHEFIKQLHARFDAEGISIPFPIRTLAYRDGRAPAVAAQP